MKYCWNHSKSTATTVFACLMLIGMTTYWIYCAVCSVVEWHWPVILTVFVFGIGMYYFCLYFLVILAHERKYHVDKYGLTLSYPFGFKTHTSWENFSEVAVCKVHYSKKGPVRFKLALRFVVGTEKRGPRHACRANEPWSEEMYEIRHWGKIITIEYSDENVEELQAVCPLAITDYRYLQDPR